MKKWIVLVSFLFIVGCQGVEYKRTFSFEPKNPQASEPILVKFLADSTKLAESKSIEMLVYEYDVDLLSTSEFAMQKDGIGWTSKFTPKAETKGMIITFRDKEIVENNNSAGFVIYKNDTEGNPLPEALAGYTVALSQWGTWYLELESDYQSTATKFEEIFDKYTEVKPAYLDFYLYTLSRIGTEEALGKIVEELKTMRERKDIPEDDVILLAKYSRVLKNEADETMYNNIILEKYPQNEYAAEIGYGEMMLADSASELKENFEKYRNEFPKSKSIDVASYRVIRKFFDENNFEAAMLEIEKLKNITIPYSFTYSINKLIESDKLEEALKLCKIGIDVSRTHLDSLDVPQPEYLSKSDWEKDLKYNLGDLLKSLSIIQLKLGDKENALVSADEAQIYLEHNDVELNGIYVSLLVEMKKFEQATKSIEKYLTENKNTSEMLELLKISYSNINGSKEGFDEYASKFAAAGKAKLIERLKGEMINEAAPDFEINDLDGNLVKLSDYKGKVVIIDFWATWCGPCMRSFPAMQEANDNFIDDTNVQFLFINSWERVEDKIANAKNFLSQNNYTVKILMDLKNEVITKYKVAGIPTKFVVGADQNIKFKSVGFSGTNEELVKELSAMIELAK
ncbi:MAG: TlpA family protein disulfide reductase [Bacteroidetes bacterium]|nr:TlpA family protein disulfide reductase [Patescibacteria group bacterium]MBU1114224.1 TlpA family protein disulfide reductase [Bacteroidota bacterium]MBU1797354.1 TlpA family protein disulfide reductase [Bacteroidota bacterium]